MRNFLRSLFGSKKSTSKIKPRMQSRRLELIGLEERVTPATISVVNNQVVIQLVDNEDITNLNTSVNGAQITINTVGSQGNTGSGTGLIVNADSIVVNTGTGGLTGFAGISVIGFDDTTDFNSVTIGATGIDLSNAPGGADQEVSINLTQGSNDVDGLNVNGVIKAKGTGGVTLNASAGTSSMMIAAAGGITTTDGAVNISSVNLTSSGDITTSSGNISFGSALNLGGNIAINSTSGNLSMGIVTAGAKNLTINQGSGTVELNNVVNITTGNLSITTTNATANAIKLQNTVAAGDISLNAGGDISAANTISAASVNAKSTAGDVIFNNTVTTTQVGGFISEATLSTKATKIAGAVSVGAGASALVTGNLITTSNNTSTAPFNPQAGAGISVIGTGAISITGKVDALASTNDLYLKALNGAITIGGKVGSGTAPDRLFVDGAGSFAANGEITTGTLAVGLLTPFATSVSFADVVKVTGIDYTYGSGPFFASALEVVAIGTGTISFSKSIETSNSLGSTYIGGQNGNIGVTGTITSKNGLSIYATGAGFITLGDNVTTDQANGQVILSSTTGDISTKGVTTSGATADINIDTTVSGNITIGGNVSTSGGGDILLGADTSGSAPPYTATGTGNLTINGTVSTTGTSTSGDIAIGSGGTGVVTVNKALSTGTANTTPGGIYLIALGTQINTINLSKDATITSAGTVNFITAGTSNTISIASGANITSAGNVNDVYSGPSTINLASNITTTNGSINLDHVSINLTGSVSMKAAATQQSGAITLGNVNGAQNLTLEATGNILFQTGQGITGVGQTTALNTVTVTNSAGVNVNGNFSAASVVLSDTTGGIAFSGNTVISKSLTTAAKAYDIGFDGTTVLAGAPVFLNTGGVGFRGTTSLTTGATITGNSTSTASLAGTIVSGGAFNIGAIGSVSINTSFQGPDNVQLILNSSSATSTFASKVISAVDDQINLLGVGALTLSGDSSADYLGSVNVINGILNVTGKIAGTATTGLTNGTITGAGGEMGILNVNTGTVAPGGTLKTAAVTFNAATNYNAAVLTNATASNLKTASAINLGGAALVLRSIPTGLIVGNVFTIIDNTATQTGINGTFASLPEGASVSAKDASGNTVAFTISYKGGTNTNDVTLTVASITPSQTATPQPMVAGQPALNKFTAFGADAGGGPLVTITFVNGTYTSFFAYDPSFIGGVRVALGDVNGDGQTDVITGAGPGGGPQVNVYNVNNQTGAVSLQSSFFAFSAPRFTGGVYVAAGQTNGDSFADVIVGAGATGGSRVQVYAGSATGVVSSSTLNDFFAYSPAFTGGVVVAAGDRNADGDDEVITAPASNGGYNIKSFNVNGTGNNPTLVDNFFAFNNTTSVGGLSLAVGYFNTGAIADLVIGTTNGAFGVIIDSNTSGIVDVPFEGFTGAIRAGVAESSSGLDYAVALAGPTGGPLVSVFAVFSNLRCVDYLFVMNPSFTGGLFGTPTLPLNAPA